MQDKIKRFAQKNWRKIKKYQDDPRYKKVIGKLVAIHVFESNHVQPYPGHIDLEDAIWVGGHEPRVLEILPALFLKKPKIFYHTENIPDDLKEVIKEIKNGRVTKKYKNIEPEKYIYWLDKIGHKGKVPSQLMTFRLSQNDLKDLRQACEKYRLKPIDVIRKALKEII